MLHPSPTLVQETGCIPNMILFNVALFYGFIKPATSHISNQINSDSGSSSGHLVPK
jgi:hypothetical protein